MTSVAGALLTVIAFVAELLALYPSFVAPVVALTVADPAAVGVPETGHEIVPPKVTDAAGLAGVHAPSVSPAGNPLALHVAVLAATVPGAALVQTMLPEYETPKVAVAGKPNSDTDMSDFGVVMVSPLAFVVMLSPL